MKLSVLEQGYGELSTARADAGFSSIRLIPNLSSLRCLRTLRYFYICNSQQFRDTI